MFFFDKALELYDYFYPEPVSPVKETAGAGAAAAAPPVEKSKAVVHVAATAAAAAVIDTPRKLPRERSYQRKRILQTRALGQMTLNKINLAAENRTTVEGLPHIWALLKPEEKTCLTNKEDLESIALNQIMALVLWEGEVRRGNEAGFMNFKRSQYYGKSSLPKVQLFCTDDGKEVASVRAYIKLNKKNKNDKRGGTKVFGPALQVVATVSQANLRSLRRESQKILADCGNSHSKAQPLQKEHIKENIQHIAFNGRKVGRLTLTKDEHPDQVPEVRKEIATLQTFAAAGSPHVVQLLDSADYTSVRKLSVHELKESSPETELNDMTNRIASEESKEPKLTNKKQKIVMYVEAGQDLNSFWESVTKDKDKDIKSLLPKLHSDLLNALHEVHRCRYVHGDIKPQNLLVFPYKSADGNVIYNHKITDFGGSRKLEEPSPVTGTIPYMSPERFCKDYQTSMEDDIYAMGCCLLGFRIGKFIFLQIVVMKCFALHRLYWDTCGKKNENPTEDDIEYDQTTLLDIKDIEERILERIKDQEIIHEFGNPRKELKETDLYLWGLNKVIEKIQERYAHIEDDEVVYHKSIGTEVIGHIKKLYIAWGKFMKALRLSQDQWIERYQKEESRNPNFDTILCHISEAMLHSKPQTPDQLLRKYGQKLQQAAANLNEIHRPKKSPGIGALRANPEPVYAGAGPGAALYALEAPSDEKKDG